MYEHTLAAVRYPLRKKARLVANIFDALAIITLVVGGLGVGIMLLVGLFNFDDGGISMLFMAVLSAVYVALLWASITLFTLVAGYIYNRSED